VARVVIFTRLQAADGCGDELEAVLQRLATATRNEPGNEVFVVHRSRDERDVFLGYEVFADDDALAAHRATDAVAEARTRMEPLLGGPPVITYALD
jgi:quinol monooxygenase YgiN